MGGGGGVARIASLLNKRCFSSGFGYFQTFWKCWRRSYINHSNGETLSRTLAAPEGKRRPLRAVWQPGTGAENKHLRRLFIRE